MARPPVPAEGERINLSPGPVYECDDLRADGSTYYVTRAVFADPELDQRMPWTTEAIFTADGAFVDPQDPNSVELLSLVGEELSAARLPEDETEEDTFLGILAELPPRQGGEHPLVSDGPSGPRGAALLRFWDSLEEPPGQSATR